MIDNILKKQWSVETAIGICKAIEEVCVDSGSCFHVAMTGGCLYGGTRKDLDLVFYSVRQATDRIQERRDILLNCLDSELDIIWIRKHGWLVKATMVNSEGLWSFDLMFPEIGGGDYTPLSDQDELFLG